MELCSKILEQFLIEDNMLRNAKVPDKEFYETRLKEGYQILQGLHTIHKVGKLIHRDLNLKNIFITQEGVLKIGEFGLATKCRHLTMIEASPAGIQPKSCPNLQLEGFSLDGGSLEEKKSDDGEISQEYNKKLFASPEQIADLPLDQKVS